MKIAFLGLGAWGFCLASLLANKGYRVKAWSSNQGLVQTLQAHKEHPNHPGYGAPPTLQITDDLQEAIQDADIIVESVTSAGVRKVFERIRSLGYRGCPIVLTSKGIEQGTGLTLPEVVVEILGPQAHIAVSLLSGPSFAQEVIRGLPASVVGSAYKNEVMLMVCEMFTTNTFRVYPNDDVMGVAYGGALKNIIAIACGISEGLSLGYSCAAALVTRGLHEIRKLAMAHGCRADTLNGLSGMGDICLTCSSPMSRNFRFGHLLAQGSTPQQALHEIATVVEGAYTCVSALQLSHQQKIPMPITETVYKIVYEGLPPQYAVELLMQRTVKQEHL